MFQRWRVNLVFVFIIILSAVIIGKLFSLQILKGDFYKALSQGLRSSFNENQLKRGEIFLTDGKPLAINIDEPLVFASPRKINDFKETASALSKILNLDENFVLDKIKGDNFYSVIKKKLNEKEVGDLKNSNLEGIVLAQETGRYYPQENFASHIIGFLGAQGIGQYGLEEYFNEILSGETEFWKSKKGSDLLLTVDYNIQFEAEKLLQKAKDDLEIEAGQIIVLEPESGRLIALATLPNFNPNQYEEYAEEGNLKIFKNGATQELFEPGSVFKPITMAAALDQEKITPQTEYQDQGFVKIGGSTVFNYDQRVYGIQSMTNVLEKSINTGAVFAESQVGHKIFLDYAKKFGIFERTGVDISETYSENKEFKKGYEINFATASFGQGIEMTALQLVRAYSAIANGGKLVKPYLVEKILEDGKEIKTEPAFSSQVISSKTASQLTAMLVKVVENGFGKAAKIPGYYIAGKTGTAQVSFSSLEIKKEGYSDRTIQTFMGFGPAFNPKFLILVKLDNPKAKTAEYSALPIFRDLAEYVINYWQIPPDYE